MNWDAIGAVGELVGAVAVVMTLVYLSIQIRENTRSNQVSAELEALQQLSNWVTRISTDKDAQRLWDLVAEGKESLSAEDSGQYLWLMGELFWVVESAFVQHQRGYLSKEAWMRFESTLAGTLDSKLTREWWQNREVPHSSQFRSYVDRVVLTDKTDWRPRKTSRET